MAPFSRQDVARWQRPSVMGLGDEPRFEKYHRALNRDHWEPLLLGRLLLGLIIKLCVPTDAPLLLAIGETLERRWGPKINYLGKFRDPVRSSKEKVVYTTGVRWLCLTIIVSVPWNQRKWALPIITIPLLAPKKSAQLGKRHRTSVARAGQLISLVRRRYPQREIRVIGDGGFAAVPLVQLCINTSVPIGMMPIQTHKLLFKCLRWSLFMSFLNKS
ncbi:MAG: hypothetical protein GY759_17740 [Chloroflexi bacterium]|nr:hypothetical protein [Chloroflexota bacterium]